MNQPIPTTRPAEKFVVGFAIFLCAILVAMFVVWIWRTFVA